MMVTSEGRDATIDEKSPEIESCCMVCVNSCKKVICRKCGCGCYCSSDCMKEHKNHTKYCPVICNLEKLENEKRIAGEIFASDSEKLPCKMKMKLIRSVGERPIVNIYLDNVGINGLWDTGSMVNVMNENFLQKNSPEVEIRSVEEVLGNNNLMANQGELNAKGIAILNFGVEKEQSLFQIPFLVTPDTTTNAIIGYNSIGYLVTNFRENIDLPISLTKIIGEPRRGGRRNWTKQKLFGRDCIGKLRCKVKHLDASNAFNKVILFTPLEENGIQSELIVFESPEVIKNKKKFITVCVYNLQAKLW